MSKVRLKLALSTSLNNILSKCTHLIHEVHGTYFDCCEKFMYFLVLSYSPLKSLNKITSEFQIQGKRSVRVLGSEDGTVTL